ncbi:Hypothetical predicted protein [Paramuricea clavata]|uniref:Uncharacterized protein n=1 Tax=Paramuricea clavata TaxID=317549 RepID=A0A7D9DI88_PARCT|nr:Hypothetical predicted protein [Paramuricea clavata]
MNSSTVINALYSFFGKKNNKLTWSGSLEDLKAFVLTIVDEETAESSTWRSPSGGKWCFDSDQLKVTWYIRRAKQYSLKGPKLNICLHEYMVFL